MERHLGWADRQEEREPSSSWFLTQRDALDAFGYSRVLNKAIVHQTQRLHDAEFVGRRAHHSESEGVSPNDQHDSNYAFGRPPPPVCMSFSSFFGPFEVSPSNSGAISVPRGVHHGGEALWRSARGESVVSTSSASRKAERRRRMGWNNHGACQGRVP